MQDLITIDDVRAAAQSIAGHVLRTPSVESPGLSAHFGVTVALKLESLQQHACFKVRGVTNMLMSLDDDARSRGIVTVSGGNHGLVVSQIARAQDLHAVIVMPEKAPARSIGIVRASGADLRLAPDATAAFEIAEQERANGLTYIHSYDDPPILAGHGTAGLEFIEEMPDLTDVIVSVGGGGLISGVSAAVKAIKPEVRIWGVETDGANCMSQALSAGEPQPIKVSSIVSTLGAPFATERTLAHVRQHVEEIFTVSDADAVAGAIALAETAGLWVEPAAGCLLPATEKVIERTGRNGRIGLVVCGANATFDDMSRWATELGVAPGGTA